MDTHCPLLLTGPVADAATDDTAGARGTKGSDQGSTNGRSVGLPAWTVFNPGLEAFGCGLGVSRWNHVRAVNLSDPA
jgi:hypothetical protein